MMFESKKDRDDLVQDVTRSLRTYGSHSDDVNTLPGEEDAPFYGHSDSAEGPSDTNTSSKNQPNSGGDFVEGLERRLCALLEFKLTQRNKAKADKQDVLSTVSTAPVVRQTGTEGTSDGKETPEELENPNKAARQAERSRPGGTIENAAEEKLEKTQRVQQATEEQDEAGQDESGSEGATGSLESLI
jgi:hypothetical protein